MKYDGWCAELNSQVKRLAESGKLESLKNNPEAVRARTTESCPALAPWPPIPHPHPLRLRPFR